MEKKSNKGLVFLVVILLFTSLGLGGYIVYDKVLNKDNNPKVDETTSKEENIEENDNSEEEQEDVTTKTRTTQILRVTSALRGAKGGTIVVTKEGTVYFIPSENQKELEGIEKIGTYGEYELEDYITGLGWDEVNQKTIEDHKFNGYKLNLENVVSAYDIEIGNSGEYQNYFFVKEDGTVDMLKFELASVGKITTVFEKNVTEHPNIVSVTQSGGFGAFDAQFIDKDGNSYNYSIHTESDN